LVALYELAADLEKDSDAHPQVCDVRGAKTNCQIFSALAAIRPAMMVSSSAADILQAACNVMTATIQESILATQAAQTQIDHLIQTTVRRREPECQEAVAQLYRRMSRLRDPQQDVNRCVHSTS
jgi:hypothetical protein